MLRRVFGLFVGLLLLFVVFVEDIGLEKRKYRLFWWWLDVALIIVLVAILTSCARVVVHHEPIPVLFVDELEVMGKTVCDTASNKPVVFIHRNMLGTQELGEVVHHEMVHSAQALNYRGGCVALMQRYSDSRKFAFDIEAEAYCSVILNYASLGQREQAVETLKSLLYGLINTSHQGRGTLSQVEADAIVDDHCRVSRPVLPVMTQPP